MADPLHASSPTCAQTLRALSRYPARTAFAWPGGSLSYQGTLDLIGRIQSVFMRLGLQPGARVAFLTANRADTWCAGVAAQLSRLCITWLHPLGSREDQLFQLEDSELDGELLPPDEGPRDRILFTESAEGGAGVLRRLQAEPDALAGAAREALRIAHFDPDTGVDLGGVRDAHGTVTSPCARGCYNCLLSYANQLSHELIDRHLAQPLLLAIAHGATLPTGIGETRTEQLNRLKRQADSPLEENFLQWLKDNGYRLPDAAQHTVDGAHARPDFIYYQRGGNVALFVDGPVHDDPHVAQRDADAAERLEDLGWNVIRLRHDDDWPQFAATHQAVFGARR